MKPLRILTVDNPLDSTSTSLQVGAVLSGAIVPDTAHFLLREIGVSRDSGDESVTVEASLGEMAQEDFAVDEVLGAPERDEGDAGILHGKRNYRDAPKGVQWRQRC